MRQSLDSSSDFPYDVVVGGGGVVGATVALALERTFGREIRIAVVSPARATGAFGSTRDAVRASALSAASRTLLETIGIWPDIAAVAQPVSRIDVTESTLDAGARPVLLSYDPAATNERSTMVIAPNVELFEALDAALARCTGIERINGTIAGLATAGGPARAVILSDGRSVSGRLVIAADGRRSALRDAAGIPIVTWPYPQSAIVTRIRFDEPHHGVAVQHFLPGGPFAVLPLTGNRACITWSEAKATAEHLVASDDATFLAALRLRLGARLGPAHLDGARDIWPLDMHLARAFTAPRTALVGDSAHGVHPIAGQGLNLSLRDVAALVECLADGMRVGLDAGDPAILTRYQRWRGFDTTMSTASFDALNRLFSNDLSLVRSMREAGLGLVDRIPMLKRMIVAEAAGLTGDVPKLLRGMRP